MQIERGAAGAATEGGHHRALRLQSAEADASISELVNDVIRTAWRTPPMTLPRFVTVPMSRALFASVVPALKKRGKL